MAIAPGNKFEYADLQRVAAQANALGASSYDVTKFYNVAPMYQDNSGNNYGYRQLTDFAVAARGTHYKAGDVVASPGGYVTMKVMAVDASGGIVGLLIESCTGFAPGSGTNWETANDPASPGGLTGGSGTGAQVTFVVAHVGPTSPYSFPDYSAGVGTVTNLVLQAAGAGYQVGDVVGLPALTFAVGAVAATVTAVDGSGAITGFTPGGLLFGYPNSLPIPASFAALTTTGGNGLGATFMALFVLPQKPAWLTELNRLRNAIYSVSNFMTPSTQLAVSGPWPVSGPDPNYLYNTLYFPASGSEVDVTMTTNIPGELSGKNTYAFHNETYTYSGNVGETQIGYPGYGTVTFFWSSASTQTASAATAALGTVIENSISAETSSPPVDPSLLNPASDVTTYQGSVGSQSCVISESTMTLIIGGNSPVLVQATFYMHAKYFCGCTINGSTGPGVNGGPTPRAVLIGNSPPSPTISGNFPGTMGIATGPATPSALGYGNYGGNLPYGAGWGIGAYEGEPAGNYWEQLIYFEVNQMVNPGRYTFTITAPTYGDDSQDIAIQFVETNSPDNGDGYWGASIWTYNCTLQPRYVLSGSFESGGLITSVTSGWPNVTSVGTVSKVINSGAVQTAGIDSTQNVWKLPLDWDANGLSAIAGQVVYDMKPCAPPFITPTPMEGGSDETGGWLNCWQSPPYFPPRDQMWMWGLSGLPTPVLWSAQTPPVSNLEVATCEQMPWNLYRTKLGPNGSGNNQMVNPTLLGDLAPNLGNAAQVSNSYDPDGSHKTVEAQLEPPAWKASRYFTVGFTIMDGNGNFQKVTTAGVSGSSAPDWATKTGLTTMDGGAVWSCVKVLESAQSITPATHRLPDMPRYPFYWFSETAARLKPPTSSSGLTIWGANNQWALNALAVNGFGQVTAYDPSWQCKFPASSGPPAVPADAGGMAFGWFIYSVSINRATYPVKTRGPASSSEFGAGDTGAPGAGDEGQSGTGAGGPGSGPNAGPVEDNSKISCTIGCMRNGSFVAFQTFKTGATYQVLWPVFNSYALVYQCSERLDIQALAIASGGNGVVLGQTVILPMCAAFLTDTVALLNML